MPTIFRRVRHGLWRLYRRPLAVVVLAVGLAGATFVVLGGAERDEQPTMAVVVAAGDVAAGSPISSSDLRVEQRVVDEVPPDAATGDVIGRVAAADLLAGEAIAERRLAPAGLGPVPALLGPNSVGVTMPIEGTPPGMAVGDRLELLAVDALDAARPLARGDVIALDDRSVTVAVPAERGPEVVRSLTSGALVPIIVGSPR